FLNLIAAGATGLMAARQYMQSCFTGDMLIDTEFGLKRIDDIAVGDKIWTRDENDPNGPLALRAVEEVFVRVAPILNLHLPGQILKTTGEHPFYPLDRGWWPAAHLRIGDQLRAKEAPSVTVQGVAESGRMETVYNFRVAEYHTYFVRAQ